MSIRILKITDEQLEQVRAQQGVKGRRFEVSGNELSMKELAKTDILFMITGLYNVDENGVAIKNRLGAKQLAPFQEVWNRLARTLENTMDADKMYAKLNKEADIYPIFQQLLDKLGPVDIPGSSDVNPFAEVNLWTNFRNAFSLTRVPLIQLTILKKEDGYQANAGEAFNADLKVGMRWQSAWRMKEADRYTNKDTGGNSLNLKNILSDFRDVPNAPTNQQLKGRELDFLHSIGWNLVDNEEAIQKLIDDGTINRIHIRIKHLNKRDIVVRSFEDIYKAYPTDFIDGEEMYAQKADRSRFRKVMAMHARYSSESSNFMVTNAEGNTQYEHSLNNSMTVMVNSINDALDYDDLINMPHMKHLDIDTNPMAKASTWLNSIFVLDENKRNTAEWGTRRQVSDDPKSPYNKIHFTNLAGVLLMEEEGDSSLGVASAKADEVTKLILDFHLSNQ